MCLETQRHSIFFRGSQFVDEFIKIIIQILRCSADVVQHSDHQASAHRVWIRSLATVSDSLPKTRFITRQMPANEIRSNNRRSIISRSCSADVSLGSVSHKLTTTVLATIVLFSIMNMSVSLNLFDFGT